MKTAYLKTFILGDKCSFLILSLILLTSVAIAQKRNTDRIYWVALEKYTLALDAGYHPNVKLKTIYLQKPENVDSLPPMMNGYNIILITGKNQRALYKEHKKTLIHTIMSSATVDDSLLYITITPYIGKLKKWHHYNLAVSDGTTVYFKYDLKEGRFVVDKIKNWGI